jgi:hypothetical protein
LRPTTLLAGIVACTCGASSAAGQELDIIEEIRGGAALSSIDLNPLPDTYVYVLPRFDSFNISNLDSLQFDVMFRSPDIGAFEWLGSLRPAVGGVINLRGRESLVHAGFNWHLPLGDVLYFEAEGGLALHNGALEGASPPLRNLGCPLLFHWSYGLGANITESWTVTANLQHVSNVVFGCSPNDGLNHFGVSLGYKF